MDKRTFLKNLPIITAGAMTGFNWLDKININYQNESAEEIASNEDYWAMIRAGYRLKPDYINLENGYYCLLPQETLENYIHHIREVNYQASFYMRNNQWDNKARVTAKLAKIAGCDSDEIVITRNTTESLDLIISGYPWQKGDEAIMAEQDYGAMRNQFMMMERKNGIKVRTVSVPDHPNSDEEIINVYKSAITPNTKLLMVCHMINITGHILPVRKIVDMAHSHGVEVMVDGAHAFAHIDFNIPDLDCDYYGASLHKWLSVPLGAGLLYIKKEKVKKTWPFMASWGKEEDDIQKLNHIGTHPVHTDLAILNAIEYFERIGAERKEERLRFLQNYWTEKVRGYPKIILNTPTQKHRSCAIANVGIQDMDPGKMATVLLEKYKIWTVGINGPVFGCRITPNVYTSTEELDVFVRALKELADQA
jgi:selenocysteine lyase/cysteine desulfurase